MRNHKSKNALKNHKPYTLKLKKKTKNDRLVK